MVTIRILGGLGNQLFQYGFGLALRHKYNRQVQFDTSFYNKPDQDGATVRELELEAFDLIDFTKTNAPALSNNFTAKVKRFFERKFLPPYKQSYIVEKSVSFNKDIFKIKSNVYLDGYWQSPRYFEGIEPELRQQLNLKIALSDKASIISNAINNESNSVSIHVRRGDYITKYSYKYYNLSVNYYNSALGYLQRQLSSNDITLFVFSDDIDWCKENMHYQLKTIMVDSKDMRSYEDMILMSQCKHNIIANSTYSWWGAWLNNNKNKIVVAPSNWLVEPESNAEYIKSIYPASWICL